MNEKGKSQHNLYIYMNFKKAFLTLNDAKQYHNTWEKGIKSRIKANILYLFYIGNKSYYIYGYI